MKTVLVAALLVLVAGCGGGSDDSGSDDSGGRFSDAMEVANAAGCHDSAQRLTNADLEMFVTSAVECEVNGNTVTINWFNSKQTRDSWKQAADSFGAAGAAYGDDWAVECPDDQADCDAVVEAID